jgi:tRNA threonylcarbamoyladenosine biosynthesis protein TsaE
MPTFLTHFEAETFDLAKRLAATLSPGSTILLYGDLGAGKTVFVRGLAAGLGIDASDVTSPTFVLLQEYHGPLHLFHADLYRLDHPEAIDDLGLEELGAGGIVAIEWADRLPRPPQDAIRVRIEDAGGDNRRITIG